MFLRCAADMYDTVSRVVNDRSTNFPDASAVVHVLHGEEVILVKETHLLHSPSRNQKKSSSHSVHFHRLCPESPVRIPVKPPEWKILAYETFQGGKMGT